MSGVVEYRFDHTAGRCSRLQAFKSISCLLYQCSEGNVPESPLFAELERIQAAIAMDIVYELPEWDAAEWDAA